LNHTHTIQHALHKNIVFFTLDEADEHDTFMSGEGSEGLVRMREIEPDFARFVEDKFDRVRREMSV
jgi:hypothetical protein